MNYLPTIRGNVRDVLRYLSDEFTDDELNSAIAECLKEISKRSPRKVVEVKTTIKNSKIIDISDITGLFYIEKAEYPTGEDPRTFCNINEIDDGTVELDIDTTPDAGGSGALIGTVTFASGSAAVTGVATLFSTELEAGYHIKKSSGTRWYRVYSIESATALTLAESCRSEDNGADTVNLTEYCYGTVYFHCRKVHELTDTATSLTPDLEVALVKGAVANAALSWISVLKTHIDEAVAKIDDVNTAIGDVAARITQSIADLTSGRTLINKVNIGTTPETDYATYASVELSNANAFLNKSSGHLRELTARLSIGSAINTYQTWANNKMEIYLENLRLITRPRTSRKYRK